MARIKRLAWLVPLVLSAPVARAAGNGYGMAGCGLGSMVFDGPGKGEQIGAATTNNSISYNQGFGITSGTSNCLTRKDSAQLRQQQEFIAANLVTLQKEMAQGGGDSVTALGEVLGCKEQVLPEVSKQLVGAYEQIFSQPGVDGVLGAAKFELKQRPALAASCSSLFG